jgi:integrase
MASITKDPRDRSPYFQACFTAYRGQARTQLKKSTATTDRRLAQRVADALEDGAQGRLNQEGMLKFLATIPDKKTERVVRRAFDDVLRKVSGTGLGSKTVRGYVTEWLERNRGTLATTTWNKYGKVAEQLFASLGGKADADMAAIRADEITEFRNSEAQRVSKSTANHALKIVRVFFAAAERDGVVTQNVARLVRKERDAKADSARRAFTVQELRRILAKCDDEWRSMVVFGLYTGARLGDVASMTWQAVDMDSGTINYVSRKTGRNVSIPIAKPLQDHIGTLAASDNPREAIHPRAAKVLAKNGTVGTLSNQFAAILADAGLVAPRTHEAKEGGPGRHGRRARSEISFHALRHTSVSLLKNAGVGEAIARDIVGHESAAVSRLYTHIEDEPKRKALSKLPDVVNGQEAVG